MNTENKEVIQQEDDYGMDKCPKCGSTNITYIGAIADGELAAYRCNKCNHYWEEIR